MQTEIEAKFLDQNHDEIREKLRGLGAECEQPMRLMRRVTIETPEMIAKNGWVRVRDEGHLLTAGGTVSIKTVGDIRNTIPLEDLVTAYLAGVIE